MSLNKYLTIKSFKRQGQDSYSEEQEKYKIFKDDIEKKNNLYLLIQKEINDNFRTLLQKKTFNEDDRKSIQYFIQNYIRKQHYFFVDLEDEKEFIEQIINDIFGMGLLEGYINDPKITEIWVNGPKKVWYEVEGRRYLSPLKFRDNNTAVSLVNKILAPINRKADETESTVDGRLADGSRVAVTMGSTSLFGTEIVIRKFKSEKFTLEDYVKYNSMTDEMRKFLITSVEAGLSILVVGGTGSGKTTLLNALSNVIPTDRGYQHIITIEDSAELIIGAEFWSRWETRKANSEGKGEKTASDLVKHALRNSPNRVILGEIRGVEAEDVLQVGQTGHKGTMTTIHSENAAEAVERFCQLVAQKGTMSVDDAKRSFANVFDLIVVVGRVENTKLNKTERKVIQITQVVGYGKTGKSKLNLKGKTNNVEKAEDLNKVFLDDLYKYDYEKCRHVCRGIVPQELLIKAREEGREYDLSIFQKTS